MNGFMVLALEMLPMLGVTAAVFAWFGWSWRSRWATSLPRGLEPRENFAEETAPDVRAEATALVAEDSDPGTHSASLQKAVALLEAELREAQARQLFLEKELLHQRDARKELEARISLGQKGGVLEQGSEARSEIELGDASGQSLRGQDEDTSAPRLDLAGGSALTLADLTPFNHLKEPARHWQDLCSELKDLESRWEMMNEEERALALPTLAKVRAEKEGVEKMLKLAVKKGGQDDLTVIRGIGAVLAMRLRRVGICTYAHLAGWTAADVEMWDRLLALRGRVERDGWIEQARRLEQTD